MKTEDLVVIFTVGTLFIGLGANGLLGAATGFGLGLVISVLTIVLAKAVNS